MRPARPVDLVTGLGGGLGTPPVLQDDSPASSGSTVVGTEDSNPHWRRFKRPASTMASPQGIFEAGYRRQVNRARIALPHSSSSLRELARLRVRTNNMVARSRIPCGHDRLAVRRFTVSTKPVRHPACAGRGILPLIPPENIPRRMPHRAENKGISSAWHDPRIPRMPASHGERYTKVSADAPMSQQASVGNGTRHGTHRHPESLLRSTHLPFGTAIAVDGEIASLLAQHGESTDEPFVIDVTDSGLPEQTCSSRLGSYHHEFDACRIARRTATSGDPEEVPVDHRQEERRSLRAGRRPGLRRQPPLIPPRYRLKRGS